MTVTTDLYVFEVCDPREGLTPCVYGVYVNQVHGAMSSLLRRPDTPVPKGVRGVAAYRGDHLLVLDLARLLSKPAASNVDVLVLEGQPGLVGIGITRLHGPQTITASTTRWNYAFCFSPLIKAHLEVADGEFAGQTINLLDVEALMVRARPVITRLHAIEQPSGELENSCMLAHAA